MADHGHEAAATTSGGGENIIEGAVKGLVGVAMEHIQPAMVDNALKIAPSIVEATGVEVEGGGGGGGGGAHGGH